MLMKQILSRGNLITALKRVEKNKGSHGDGMSSQDLRFHVSTEWTAMKVALLEGNYEPQPVRRVEIPKPDGGVRLLGILPKQTVSFNRLFLQILSPIYDVTFSEHSYGFRPNRSAHDAVM
jgi:RNA-directed DNA polymerase